MRSLLITLLIGVVATCRGAAVNFIAPRRTFEVVVDGEARSAGKANGLEHFAIKRGLPVHHSAGGYNGVINYPQFFNYDQSAAPTVVYRGYASSSNGISGGEGVRCGSGYGQNGGGCPYAAAQYASYGGHDGSVVYTAYEGNYPGYPGAYPAYVGGYQGYPRSYPVYASANGGYGSGYGGCGSGSVGCGGGYNGYDNGIVGDGTTNGVTGVPSERPFEQPPHTNPGSGITVIEQSG
ncbi:shematrin-like protein 2 [Diachasmimorpha longicaudata]|uniref:shematrin-like protein 2 n=1 Tax=Diachasmimorpha longicaudata TaxID=58733 RepID=UPI0030B8F5DE